MKLRNRVATVVFGLAVAAALYGLKQYISSLPKVDVVTVPDNSVQAPASSPPKLTSESPVVIRLTPGEQTSFGVQTTHVKRQTIRKEMSFTGKVAAPETYDVTDPSTVWVQIDVLELDIPTVRNGMDAMVKSSALGGEVLHGKIASLQPSVVPESRTLRALIQVPNPGMRLRPEMFVQVSVHAVLTSAIVAVPRAAVLHAGKDLVVYVATDNGLFERRIIEAQAIGNEYYSIKNGLHEGERVVTKGNFAIDSLRR